jgi:soluble lytic murein transglycosylase
MPRFFTILCAVLLAVLACTPHTALVPGSTADNIPTKPTPQSFLKAYDAASASQDPEQCFRTALDAFRAGNHDAALLIARRVAERYPGTVWYRRSLFVALQASIQLDRPSDADAAMLRVHDEYSELADYALFLLADYHYAKTRYNRSAALYEAVLDRHPRSFLVAQASYRRAMALSSAAAYLAAIDVFDKFLTDYPRSELAPSAGLGLARALAAEAQLDRAVQTYHDVWTKYAGTDADQDVEQALHDLKAAGATVPEFTAAELYERGKNLFRLNQYDKAADAFTKLLSRDPTFPNRADVLYRTGVSLFNLAKRGDAAVVLSKMVRDYPDDPRTPEALYWLGKSYSKLGEWDRGVKTFQKILDRHPQSDWADDALFLTGNIYRESGDMKKALRYYGRLVEEYPDSNFADSAIWWKAWSLYTSGEYKKAEQAMQELVTRYPRSFLVNQARYWQGRAAEKRGDPSRAIAYYERVLKKGPYTYYGSRAAERKERLLAGGAVMAGDDAAMDATAVCADVTCAQDLLNSFESDEGPPVWTDEAKQLLAANPQFRKTLELMQLDLRKEAAQELWALQDSLPRKRGMVIGLSKAFFELGDYNRSLLLVLRNYERYLPAPTPGAAEDLWLLAYPQGYWDSILSYSRKYGQDPFFIAAIIREESQFSSAALSPAGARGLMQVMPTTGEHVAQVIKLKGFDRGKLFEADTAINIGTWYISQLMKRFKNDPLLVAAAYNAGPEAVAGWLSRNGYPGEREAFVEAIPYAETRGYVKKVLRNYAEYKRIYAKPKDQPALAQPQNGSKAASADGTTKIQTP